MSSSTCHEIVLFRPQPHVTRDELLLALAQSDVWLQTQPGFLQRTLVEDPKSHLWIDTVLWRSEEDAHRAMRQYESAPCASAMMAEIDPASLQMLHGTAVQLLPHAR